MPTMHCPPSLRHNRCLAASLCIGALLAIAPALANGGASKGAMSSDGANSSGPRQQDTSESPDANAADLTTCRKGQVWDIKRKTCVQMHSGVLPDEAMADYAFALAKVDRYPEALDVLDLLTNPETPKALNYRGYVTRKLGRTDEGIGYYLRSVALDPHYVQVREYLGEAYVIKGQLDLARDQLTTIKTLCGVDCESYHDLSEAIDRAPKL